MPKPVLILLLAAAVAATCVLLMWQVGGGSIFGKTAEHAEVVVEPGKELTAPRLEGAPGDPRPRRDRDAVERPPPRTVDGEVLRVQVVDDATGGPVARARLVFDTPQEPCPRLPPAMFVDPLSLVTLRIGPARVDEQTFSTNGEGVFEFPEELWRPLGERFDVFVQAPGYVVGLACSVKAPGTTTLRLRKGVALRGRVSNPRGEPLAGVILRARPGVATAWVPGHAGWAHTDGEGRFAIDGLLGGPLTVLVEHPGHWPLTVQAEDPSDDRERAYVLQPAFTFKFRLRTNDGREIVNPTLQANAPTARPPFQHLGILKLLDDKNPDGQLTEGVMVPASVGTVALELKAEGYAAWRAPAEPVPPEGGERVLPVTLDRDAGQGGVRLTFEDERGQRLKYFELRALPPSIMALERQDLAGGIVYEIKEDLRFPSLPPGKYRFEVRAFAYAPATVDTVIVGGTESEVRVAFRQAARLRVRFTAPTARIVRFRLTQSGRTVPALPEMAEPKPTDTPLTEEPVLSAGEAGALLGGLASGSYVVEVLSEDLQPSRTSVTVREGETEELEIRVTPK